MRWSLLLVVVAATAAYADPRDEARLHFESASARFDRGEYSAALAEFQAAYRLAPFAELLYDIARCEEHLHQPVETIQAYERYLAVAPPGPERDQLEEHLAELRRALFDAPPPAEPAPLPKVGHGPPPPPRPAARRRWPILVGAGAGTAVAAVVAVVLGVTLAEPSPRLDFPPIGGTAR